MKPIRPRPPWLVKALSWTAVALALAGVFAAYARPQLVIELANQLWACF